LAQAFGEYPRRDIDGGTGRQRNYDPDWPLRPSLLRWSG
jgi:hypothetical protein